LQQDPRGAGGHTYQCPDAGRQVAVGLRHDLIGLLYRLLDVVSVGLQLCVRLVVAGLRPLSCWRQQRNRA